MGKAISELDSYAGPMSGTTKLPVSDGDTLKTATASQVKTYIEGEIGTTQFRALLDDADAAAQRATLGLGDAAAKNTGTTTGTVAAGDHTHSGYAGTGAIGSSGLTMATGKLLGRSTAATGAIEEITVGSGLTLSGGSLTASGGSGTVTATAGSLTSDAVVLGAGGTDTKVSAGLSFASATGTLSVPGPVSMTIGARGANGWDTDGRTLFVNGGIFRYGYNFGSTWEIGQLAFVSSSSFGTQAFGAGQNSSVANIDVAFRRNAAGVFEIDNGTAGTFRDLKLRNLIGTGNLATGAVAKTADYTATTSDGTIEVDASGAARTITLFACSGNAGKILVIKKTDSSANAVTVDGNASETIDGATTISLASQYSTAILQVNAAGTGWNKLAGV